MRPALLWLVALALLAHGLGLRNGFVYDDHRFVEENPALARAGVMALFLDPSTQTADADRDVYRPLRALGHALDLRAWGPQPFGFHLHSLTVHVVNVLLGWLLLRRLLPDHGDAPALIGATVLAVHPLGVEVVGWISSRGDLYALGFGLLALLCVEREARARGRASRGALLASAALLAALATLGKESAACLPLIGFAAARLLGRVRAGGVVVLAAGVGLALLLRQVALANLSPIQTAPHGGSFWMQAGWALYGTGRMLIALAWPTSLSVEYPQASWAAGTPVWIRLPTLLAMAALAAAIALRRRRPAAAFALAWLLLAWLPSSSLLVTLRTLVTDRGAYPCLLAAGMLPGLLLAHRPRAAWLASGVLAALLIPISVQRTQVFHDDAALWQDVLVGNPNSVRAHLGLAAASAGVNPDVQQHELQAAAGVASPGGRLQGLALARLGDFLLRVRADAPTALPTLQRALECLKRGRDRPSVPDPDEPATAASLAECLTVLGRNDEGDRVLQAALLEQPDLVMLHIKRAALALFRFERDHDGAARELAVRACQDARRLDPKHPLVQALQQRLDSLATAESVAVPPR